jgi:hypothetical protein
MTGRAKAAVLVAPRQIESDEFPLPPRGDDDGLLRIEATGVCGSDVAVFRGDVSVDLFPMPLVAAPLCLPAPAKYCWRNGSGTTLLSKPSLWDHALSHLRATAVRPASGEPTSSSISRLAFATAAWRSVGSSAGSFGGTIGAQRFQAAAASLSTCS